MKTNCFKLIWILFLILIQFSCKEKKAQGTFVKIETQFGDIEIQLFPDKAPKSVSAFLSFIDSGYYKNSNFYRVLKEENQPTSGFRSEVIQGGIYLSNYKLSQKLPGIPHESTNETHLLHLSGTISLARTIPGTASSEFFICVGDQKSYDYGGEANPDRLGYAAFGRVTKGYDIVKKIHSQPENGEDFQPPVKIINIKRI